ncbi:urea carboxylase precursor [Arboricoccus pini]|uniref:Urea carboxylase n=1 Tax=Arboricoccus pini TaxID=1963835 RepID=A0A212RG43_9PROT|nr:5-oxoprolinase/urea amidolyase family protein [Arboricoccus pini]SNB71317.1 urea carboxylase precursor [Arboricoccus pini]
MFRKVLIANRGEIAARIQRTLRQLGVRSVAIASEADRFTLPVRLADERVILPGNSALDTYLNIEAVIAACRQTGAEAVHPGYGFLSESAEFALRLADEGIAFIGPRPEHLRSFGLKHEARRLASESGVPLLPGSALLDDLDAALGAAETIGYPLMLKSTAGGGGIGMRLCRDASALAESFAAVQRTAGASFGDARVYLERFVAAARHVEVQIFGDGKGGVLALGERDCSLQRRNQKVVEETPAPGLSEATREGLHAAAVKLARGVAYESAGTVEFIFDAERGDFFFLEVNTRLQVEHPVTEAVFGVDLVACMVRQAAGENVLDDLATRRPQGAAIEARLYAESPLKDFQPSAGRLTELVFPDGARVDGWIETGTEVSTFYDPLLAKIIVAGPDRQCALEGLRAALAQTRIQGIETNLDYLRAIAASSVFATASMTTSTLQGFAFCSRRVEVLTPGAMSSLQELPGRLGFWHVGVPPSGPMDSKAHRLANRIVGNAEESLALEVTASGPTLRFHADALIGLAGAAMAARLDDEPVPMGRPVAVRAGQILAVGAIDGPGLRGYLAVRGAFEAASLLGSAATFTLGGFGGHATGALRAGDMLAYGDEARQSGAPAPVDLPALSHEWQLQTVYGPHGAPDFFTEDDVATLFSATYEVHFNSARTGVRLIGPKPEFARQDGGEAGLHPSNLHDNAYAIGAIDFTGDMPIILGPDGPSLGGFVCPGVVAQADLWKLGQLRPGDRVRFVPTAGADPIGGPLPLRVPAAGSAILAKAADAPVPVAYRRQGDANLLVEYGAMTLDLALRLRVQLLMEALVGCRLQGIIDLTPGIRSLQIHYDPALLARERLLAVLVELEDGLPAVDAMRVPSRIVHLPLSWNDSQVVLAMRRYQELVRPDAPWCPSNIEFIRRINGLEDEAAVQRIILNASYLVMGLGDVYLGAPVATPLDPRHRLVTTKYNPARPWTPENAVGIGGAYMCIYGMEGPGGYQLFGRTIQMWNSWRTTPVFKPGHPWLLRFFDQVRFHLVSEQELLEARAAFPHGAYPIEIEETVLDYGQHARMLKDEASSIAAFQTGREAAFAAERRRWQEAGIAAYVDETAAGPRPEGDVPEGHEPLMSSMPGSVWRIVAEPGQPVRAGDVVIVLEAMKMEVPIPATTTGILKEIRVRPGQVVRGGDILALVEPSGR